MSSFNLKAIPPPQRLIFVIIATSGILFIENIYISIGATVISAAIFICSGRPSRLALYFIVAPTVLLYFFGNFLFSPQEGAGVEFLIFQFNYLGLELAVGRSLRIAVVLLISLAWIRATPINEIYASVIPVPGLHKWALSICRSLQLTKRDFLAMAQSLRIRGMKLQSLVGVIKTRDWHQVQRNVVVFLALLRVIISRQFTKVPKATIAWERHHPTWIRSAAGNSSISAHGIYVRYNAKIEPILQNASLEFHSPQVIYVVGRACAGKSTLLRALGGIIPRIYGELAGQVQISGINTTELTLGEYASLATYTDLDIESNILGLTVGQEIMLIAKDATVGRHCLERMGIGHLWERETTKLSGGQQVRLLLAGTLANRASVIILDDPLEQLDPEGCKDFVAAMSDLYTREARSIIIADRHYHYFISSISTVLLIEKGQVHNLGGSEALSDKTNLEEFGINNQNILSTSKPRERAGLVAAMNNVHVAFEDILALKGVTLDIAAGEVVAIRGSNGSGKTTAMLTLAGVIKPLKGSIFVEGRIGYVFQDASTQIVAPTAFEELALAPRMQGRSDAEVHQIVSNLLDYIGVSGSDSPLDLHPQKIKLLAVAAMSIGVKLMILDEPSIGLDSIGISKIVSLIENMRRGGAAVFIISHDEIFAENSDRVLQFDDGHCRVATHSKQTEAI